MTVTAKHTFGKGVDDLWALVSDGDAQKAKFEALGARNVEIIKAEKDGGNFTIEYQRDVQADPPSFAKKFVSEWNTLREKIVWTDDGNGGKKGVYSSETVGGPSATINGTMHIQPEGDGCSNTITMTASVNVPLVGKKIAAMIEGDTEKALEEEYGYTKNKLG